MMKNLLENEILVTVTFSFQGKVYNYQAWFKLPPKFWQLEDFRLSLPQRLAEKVGLDTYSYAYEVMEISDYYIAEAKGKVAQCLKQKPMLIEDFMQSCQNYNEQVYLDNIFQQLPTSYQNDKVKAALTQAFELGQHLH